MGKHGSSQTVGSDSDFVTLTIPRALAQDFVHALNLALGSEGEKKMKVGKKGGGLKKK